MKLLMFTVHDKAVGAFLQPFFVRARGEALRNFTEACNDKASNFAKYPLDYTLVYLGEYDDVNGAFSASEPQRVISANEVVIDNVFPPDAEVKSQPRDFGMPASALNGKSS